MKKIYKRVKREEAIRILEQSNSEYVILSAFDFENDFPEEMKKILKSEGEKMINEAGTITYTVDEFMANLGLYSSNQPDIMNIRRKGKMSNLLLII